MRNAHAGRITPAGQGEEIRLGDFIGGGPYQMIVIRVNAGLKNCSCRSISEQSNCSELDPASTRRLRFSGPQNHIFA